MKSILLFVAFALLASPQSTWAMAPEKPNRPGHRLDSASAMFFTITTTFGLIWTSRAARATSKWFKGFAQCHRETEPFDLITIEDLTQPDDIIIVVQETGESDSITDLMEELSKKVALHTSMLHSTPTMDFAWLHIMRAFILVTADAVLHAVAEGQPNHNLRYVCFHSRQAAFRTAHCSACLTDLDAIFEPAQSAAMEPMLATVYDSALLVAREAVERAVLKAFAQGATLREAGQIAYNVSETTVLMHFIANFDAVIESALPGVLEVLAENPAENPFVSDEALAHFITRHFRSMKPEAMAFYAPWLVHMVPIHMVPQIHQHHFVHVQVGLLWPHAFQFMLAEDDTSSTLQIFPSELRRSILFAFISVTCPQPR